MICPHCGNQVENDAQECPVCGSKLAQGVNWGVRTHAKYGSYSPGNAPTSAYIAATPRRRKTHRIPKIIAGILSAALIGAIGYAGFTFARSGGAVSSEVATSEQAESSDSRVQAKWHDVTIAVSATGFDENSTPLPVEITGADAAGNSFNQIAYVKSDGTGLRLPAGKFGIHPAASPITADGHMFLFNSTNKWFSVDTELESGTPVDASEEVQITLEPADPTDLSNDGVDAARNYAVNSGLDEATVDAMLEPVRTAIAERQSTMTFANSQKYRNTTYVGDVRANNGYASAAGIENTRAMPVRTDLFLFTNNMLYYADDAPQSEQSAISLHSRNMSTGADTVVATDLCSQTLPVYANGTLYYEAFVDYSHVIKQAGNTPEESASLSDRLPGNITKLVGVTNDGLLVATSNSELPQLAMLPFGEGEATVAQLGEEYGDIVGVFGDYALVSIPGWESNRLRAYPISGGESAWDVEFPGGFKLGPTCTFDGTYLYAINPDATQAIRLDVTNGEHRVYGLNAPYVYDIMLVRDGHLFFAGSDTYNDSEENVMYSVYDLDLENDSVANIGTYETPKNQGTSTDQQNESQNDWGSEEDTWTDTYGTWGNYGYGYGYGTGTDTTGTYGYGYGTGTDTTGTYGYGYGTGTDTTGTYGYGYGTGTGTGTDTTGTYGYGYGTGTDTTGTYGYGTGTGTDTTGTYGYGTGTGTGTGYGY